MKVVCVRSHPDGVTQKGRIYVLTNGPYRPGCKCTRLAVTIGILDTNISRTPLGGVVECADCGQDCIKTTHEWEFHADRFRPLQEDLTAELARTWKESVPSEQEHFPIPQQA